MPNVNPNESEADFVARYMGSEEAKKSFPDEKQRLAVAYSEYKKHKQKKSENEFFVKCPISRFWEAPVEVTKSAGKVEKLNQRFVEVVVSGIKEDRDGEMFSKEAVDDMVVQFKSGTIPFFPDHGFHETSGKDHVYSWKQMMGVWVDANLDEKQENIKAVVRLNNAHSDHELFWNYINEGMPIGFSIGGRTTEPSKMQEVEMEEKK